MVEPDRTHNVSMHTLPERGRRLCCNIHLRLDCNSSLSFYSKFVQHLLVVFAFCDCLCEL